MVQGIFGMALFILVAWAISENRKKVSLRLVAGGILLQFAIAFIAFKMPGFKNIFMLLNRMALSLEASTKAGTSFVFGYLGGAPLPFDEKFPGAGFILAFQALPLVLFISALSSLLFYLKIIPAVVRGFSWFFKKSLGIGGAEALGVSTNIFVGMVEAPLFIRPYMNEVTRSELFTIMTTGMATIAGTVMVIYASILSRVIPDAMGHILTASIISAPAAVLISKIMIPETGPNTAGEITPPTPASSAMDAITRGTFQGIGLLLNIVAMLIVLVALVHLVNLILGLIPAAGGKPLTLQRIFGIIMAPVTWLLGLPWSEAKTGGTLLGIKTVLNEFIAYLELSRLPENALSVKSRLIMTYALCGFANPGSLGIMIGGLGAIAPKRRDEIVSLGFRSIVAGTLAACMTGCVVGILY